MLLTGFPLTGRHEAYYMSKEDQTVQVPNTENKFLFKAHELVNVEVSYKVGRGFCYLARPWEADSCQYSEEDTNLLFSRAGLRAIQRWTDPSTGYSLWLLERPAFTFPFVLGPSASAFSNTPFGTPSFEDF